MEMPTECHHFGLCSSLAKLMGIDSCTVLVLSLSNVVLFSEFVQ